MMSLMSKKIRKAIIPAAGYGTRFLPATKASPKEMMPIVDKPVIQYVVEDAVSAGIEDILIVTGAQKRSIEDHFDNSFELEKRLEDAGKTKELQQIRDIANLANFHYIRQKGPLGNATPIWNAKDFVGNEPFLVLFGDDFFRRDTLAINTINQGVRNAQRKRNPLVGSCALTGRLRAVRICDRHGKSTGTDADRTRG
jgi:UTP--glucose-1-phosphate uridylyltransferase